MTIRQHLAEALSVTRAARGVHRDHRSPVTRSARRRRILAAL